MLLLLDVASEFQPFCQLSLRVIVGTGRGDLFILVYLTSCVFVDTTLSIQIGGSVVEIYCV